LVLDADGHSEKSILQSLVQSNAPPGDGQVKLPKLLPSHCSPGSSTPLPQSAEVVVVVVLVVTVVVVEAPVVVVVDVVGAVVVVAPGFFCDGTHSRSRPRTSNRCSPNWLFRNVSRSWNFCRLLMS